METVNQPVGRINTVTQELVTITNLNEVGKEQTLVFIYSESCGHSKKVEPVVEEFAKTHKVVKILSPNVKILSRQSTPTFLYYKDGQLYNLLRSSMTTLEDLELGWNETAEVMEGRFLKPTVLFLSKEDCGSCALTLQNLEAFIKQNPYRRLWKAPMTPELREKYGIPDEATFPVLLQSVRGEFQKDISQGFKTLPEIKAWVDAVEFKKSEGGCGGHDKPVEAVDIKHLKETIAKQEAEIKRLWALVERLTK